MRKITQHHHEKIIYQRNRKEIYARLICILVAQRIPTLLGDEPDDSRTENEVYQITDPISDIKEDREQEDTEKKYFLKYRGNTRNEHRILLLREEEGSLAALATQIIDIRLSLLLIPGTKRIFPENERSFLFGKILECDAFRRIDHQKIFRHGGSLLLRAPGFRKGYSERFFGIGRNGSIHHPYFQVIRIESSDDRRLVMPLFGRNRRCETERFRNRNNDRSYGKDQDQKRIETECPASGEIEAREEFRALDKALYRLKDIVHTVQGK